MTSRSAEIVATGLAFPEGPRWHDGRLWVSDQHDRRIVTIAADGTVSHFADVPGQPSGLGWLPDGRLLAVSMHDRAVLRFETGGPVRHADLSALAPGECNDMVVDSEGRAYVGNFGFDMYAREEPRETVLVLVEPTGESRVVAEGLAFPNGSVITPDGLTLLVGESMAGRISAFTIAADGSLSDRREWARIEGATVDGMCLDAEDHVWAACPATGRVLRIREGGAIVDEVRVSHPGAFACMLGGPDLRTLYICTAPSHVPERTRATRAGRIEAIVVDVAGAGRP